MYCACAGVGASVSVGGCKSGGRDCVYVREPAATVVSVFVVGYQPCQ